MKVVLSNVPDDYRRALPSAPLAKPSEFGAPAPNGSVMSMGLVE